MSAHPAATAAETAEALPDARRVPPRLAAGATIAAIAAVVVSANLWAGYPVTLAAVVVTIVTGVSLGSIYAMAASGIVVTYTTTGIFNFAQGAVGTLMAFLFWELSVNNGLPTLPAILLVVLVIAPAFGALLERILMRHLLGSSLVVQLVVTIGLMLGLMGLVQSIWDPTTARSTNFLFGFGGFHVGDTVVLWHRTITIGVALALAVVLRLLLHRSRVGITMRAVVDNPQLAALHGARPARVSMLAWALSSSMAALAGILLAPETSVAVEPLALLTISSFAPAIIGRLRSLPLTFGGAIVLGLTMTFAKNWLDLSGRWVFLTDALPSIFLLVALLALPQSRLQFSKIASRGQPRPKRQAPWLEVLTGLAVVFVVVAVVSAEMNTVDLNRLTLAIVTAVLLLSYLPLTGWAGQVSLAQITFAGIGAFTMWKFGETGNLLVLVLSALVAMPFGFLMALPALRLHGLYLALASLAFAFLGDFLLFGQPEIFGSAGRVLRRGDFLGVDLQDHRNFLLFATLLFALAAVGIVALRRSKYGRRLIAIRDSEAASVTFGVSPIVTKLAVFGLSAAIAGFAGGLFALHRTSAAATDYTMMAGVGFLLLVVVGGVELMGGALFGGIMSVFFLLVQQWWDVSLLQAIEILGPGLLALGVASNPDGAIGDLGRAIAPLLPWRSDARRDLAHERMRKREAKERRRRITTEAKELANS